MKKLISSIFTLLLATILIAAIPTEAEALIYEHTIRLHILANSDSEYDQELKIMLRDKILEKYGTLLSQKTDITEAEAELQNNLESIEAYANECLYDSGYTAKVSLTNEWYDTRYYEDFTLPKGYYKSLIIEIGKGEGKNWWCVMYPPMCLGLATSDAEYSKSEKNLILGKYNVKFKVLELLSESIEKKNKGS